MTDIAQLSPKAFGLSSRTVIEQQDDSTIALVIDRKTRIIMTDGKKILEKISAIKRHRPTCRVILKTSAPLCSKTSNMFAEAGVEIASMKKDLFT